MYPLIYILVHLQSSLVGKLDLCWNFSIRNISCKKPRIISGDLHSPWKAFWFRWTQKNTQINFYSNIKRSMGQHWRRQGPDVQTWTNSSCRGDTDLCDFSFSCGKSSPIEIILSDLKFTQSRNTVCLQYKCHIFWELKLYCLFCFVAL